MSQSLVCVLKYFYLCHKLKTNLGSPWHLPSCAGFFPSKNQLHSLFHFSVAEMQNKSTAGWLARFSHLSLSYTSTYLPVLSIAPFLPLQPSIHPSIHCCSLALCGESAVTVCPSSCVPSCLGQMDSSSLYPPSSMMSMRAPLTWSHGQLAPPSTLLSLSLNTMEKKYFCCK